MTHITLPAYVRQILTKLHTSGYEAYAVGGCVRDALLGRPIGDYDITTSATPRQIKRLFRRSIDTGIEHGTVTVLIGDDKCEVTTYRLDGTYTDRRRPDSVTFARSLAEDLKRRDFTINALAYSDETGIIDMYDGISDLESRIIRCVGEPKHRFGEDALRMLRAIRFSAQLSFDIEPLTYEAINALASTTSYVSKERIYVELSKILMSDHPEYISLVHDTGISRYIADGFADIDGGIVGLDALALPKDLALRWASFFHINLHKIEEIFSESDSPMREQGRASVDGPEGIGFSYSNISKIEETFSEGDSFMRKQGSVSADRFKDINKSMLGAPRYLPSHMETLTSRYIEKARHILHTLKIDNATLRKVLATLTMLYDRPATTHIDRYIKMKACEHGWDVVEEYLAILLARSENCHSSIVSTNTRAKICTDTNENAIKEELVPSKTIPKHTVYKYSDVSKNSTALDSYIKELERACDTRFASEEKQGTQRHGIEKRSTQSYGIEKQAAKECVHIQTISGHAPMSHQTALEYMARTRQLKKSGAPIRVSDLAISGNDLKQKLSLTEGRLIGTVLTALLMCTYDRPELNTYETLLWLAEDMQN